jgi:hypothetical protein
VDAGERKDFGNGAIREPKLGAWFLIPFWPMEQLAILFQKAELGTLEIPAKYLPRNWQNGLPISTYINAIFRHTFKLAECWEDEDHLTSIAWNAFCANWTLHQIELGNLPKELDDRVKPIH